MSARAGFQSFRDQLDEHNDRRERIIKASRDITALSKKVVFLLHRQMTLPDPDPNTAAAAARPKLAEIQRMLAALKPDLQGDRFWRYQGNVSPGLQEYIEALSFAHYLDTRSLLTFQDVQQSLTNDDGQFFPLTLSDYLLGLSDLTGELMRFAISAISRRGGRQTAADVCSFVRAVKADFERYSPGVRDLGKKQRVTAQSLVKIEDAAYAIAVRSSEFDLPPERLDDLVAQTLASASREFEEHTAASRRRSRRDEDDGEDDD
ncbi:unnamed protein product [Peniophora sp. CBMAI 1063]|nr:unnamed protein product [Peniophora sp. CBMAI 1063]